MKLNYRNGQRPNHLVDSTLTSSLGCTFSDGFNSSVTKISSKKDCSKQDKKMTQPSLLESLRLAFQTNKNSLNSPFHKLNQNEFMKVKNSLKFYRSCVPDAKFVEWCIENGENSKSAMFPSEATKQKIVCYFLSKKHKVLGKFVINNAESKLIMPRIVIDGNISNLQLLKNMAQLTDATIKDRYVVPTNHTKLSGIEITASRLQIFGVVTAVRSII